MTHQDEALSISNPRLLCAIYFSLLSVIFTFILHIFLSSVLGIQQLLPVFEALILAGVVSAIFGALFGQWIIYSEKHYLRQAFFGGFLMIILALPVYDLGFFYLYGLEHPKLYMHARWEQLVSLYGFILLDSFILVGIWLAILAGLAAMYLRGRLVYHILHSLND